MLAKFKREVEFIFDDVNLENEIYNYYKPHFLYLVGIEGIKACNTDTLEYSQDESFLEKDCMLLTKHKNVLFISSSGRKSGRDSICPKLMLFDTVMLKCIHEMYFDNWIASLIVYNN